MNGIYSVAYLNCDRDAHNLTLELANAFYSACLSDERHDNFIAYIYRCIEREARKIRECNECEEYHEYMEEKATLIDCINYCLFDREYLIMRGIKTVRDYMCKFYIDVDDPFEEMPLVFSFDATYDYKHNCPYIESH